MEDFRIDASWATEPAFYEAPFPRGGKYEPSPYQHAAVEYRLAREHGLIADAPGLGKTAESVLVSNAMGSKRTLVVCPASLRLNWAREIDLWSTTENVQTYPILKGSDGVSPEADYLVISYHLLLQEPIMQALLAMNHDHLIMDEAHALKNWKGNTRTQAINRLLPNVGNITMLTGTPMPNQPMEIFNAIRILDWGMINEASADDFKEYYYAMGGGMVDGPYKKNITHPDGSVERIQTSGLHYGELRNIPRRMQHLQDNLRGNIMVRRLKEHVLPQLPAMQWHPVPLAMTAGIRSALKNPAWIKAERLFDMDPDAFSDHIEYDGEFSTARRELGEAKGPSLVKYCEDLLLEVDKIVVGAWHKDLLAYLREKLKKYTVVYMDGSTSAAKRQAAVDTFQEDPKCRIIMGQVLPLGEGWTLTAASQAVLCEPHPSPGKNDQFLERLHRRGQMDNVLGHIPMVPNSLDERMLSLAIGKDQVTHLALDHREEY